MLYQPAVGVINCYGKIRLDTAPKQQFDKALTCVCIKLDGDVESATQSQYLQCKRHFHAVALLLDVAQRAL